MLDLIKIKYVLCHAAEVARFDGEAVLFQRAAHGVDERRVVAFLRKLNDEGIPMRINVDGALGGENTRAETVQQNAGNRIVCNAAGVGEKDGACAGH